MSFTPTEEFFTIAARVKASPIHMEKETKLLLYGLYKQTTIGDTDQSDPWVTNVETAKLRAWVLQKGTPRQTTQDQYIAKAKTILGET